MDIENQSVNTAGGANVGRDVDTKGGDFIGRDKKTVIHVENSNVTINPDTSNITLSHLTPFLTREKPLLRRSLPSYELVGRDELLKELKLRLFTTSRLTLCALNGLPGVGKTALAEELAHDPQVVEYFEGGILWASLGPQPDPVAILDRWSDALRIRSDESSEILDVSSEEGLNEGIRDRLRLSQPETIKRINIDKRIKAIHKVINTRRMLIVIDDVWDREIASIFRIGGSQCAYLLTTRVSEVASFFGDVINVPELSEEYALLLLEQLAPKVVAVAKEEAIELVRMVGCLPLALILIGNYLRIEASTGRLQRIRDALEKLKEADVRLKLAEKQEPLRQHSGLPASALISLEAVIELSEQALSQNLREEFHSLSVFPPKPNTFSETAALSIGAMSSSTFDNLINYRLVEHAGDDRYTLHQTIADYARLRRKDISATERMVRYFADFVENNERNYVALAVEQENIKESFTAAAKQNMSPELVRGAIAFYNYLESIGRYSLASDYIDEAEQAAKKLGDKLGLARALRYKGHLIYRQESYQQAEEYYIASLELARDINDHKGIAASLHALAAVNTTSSRNNYRLAEKYYLEGLELAKQIGDNDRVLGILHNLGWLQGFFHGNFIQAQEYYLQGVDLAQKVGANDRMVNLYQGLADLATQKTDYLQAETYLHECLKLAKEINYFSGIYDSLTGLYWVASQRGDYELAEKFLQDGLALAKQNKDDDSTTRFLHNLGDLKREQKEFTQSEYYLNEGLQLAQRNSNVRRMGYLLANLSILATQLENFEQAQAHFLNFLSQDIENIELIFNVTNHHGWNTVHRWDFAQAEIYWQEGLTRLQRKGQDWQIAILLGNLGWLADRLGRYKQAEVYLKEGLKLIQLKQNESALYQDVTSYLLTNWGAALIHRGIYRKAGTILQKGLKLARETNNSFRIDILLENLGIVATRRGKHEKAQEFLQEGLQLAGAHAERKCALLTFLGALSITYRDYTKAQLFLDEALVLGRKDQNPERLGVLLEQLGILATHQNNYLQAEQFFQEGLDLVRKIQYRWLLGSLLASICDLYLEQHKPESAFTILNEALEIAQEIDSRDLFAKALYGLARYSVEQGHISEGIDRGKRSLLIFKKIQHIKAEEVNSWLKSIEA